MKHRPAWLINRFIYLHAGVLVVPLSKALALFEKLHPPLP